MAAPCRLPQNNWHGTRREEKKANEFSFRPLFFDPYLIGNADQGSGPWRCPPHGLSESSWAAFEVGGYRVALLKSGDFDGRSSQQQREDRLTIEIGVETRRRVFQALRGTAADRFPPLSATTPRLAFRPFSDSTSDRRVPQGALGRVVCLVNSTPANHTKVKSPLLHPEELASRHRIAAQRVADPGPQPEDAYSEGGTDRPTWPGRSCPRR